MILKTIQTIIFTLLIIFPASVVASDGSEAFKKFGHAYIKYNKIDKQLNKLEKKYVDENIRKYSKWTALAVSAYDNQYVSYKWEF